MTKIDRIFYKFEQNHLRRVFLEASHESFSSEVDLVCKECSYYAGSFVNSFYMFFYG